MHSDFAAAGETRHDVIAADFPGWVDRLAGYEAGIVPDGLVPSTCWWLEDDDGRLLGGIRLRHRLSPALWQDGGHIGYDVRPSERSRGLATRMLRMVLGKAKGRGFDWVLLTVAPDNAPSIRVIEKCGGRPLGAAEESGYLRFRIDLE
jgi:predicted acetyltransferase